MSQSSVLEFIQSEIRQIPPRGELLNERVYRAAVRIVELSGLSGLTLNSLAAMLHMGSAALQQRAGDIEAIKDCLTVRALGELLAQASDAVTGLTGRAALVALAQAESDYARDNPGMHEAAMRCIEERTEEASRVIQGYRRLQISVLEAYGIHPRQAPHMLHCLRAAILGFIRVERCEPLARRSEMDESLAMMVSMLDVGFRLLGHRASETPPRVPPTLESLHLDLDPVAEPGVAFAAVSAGR